MLYTPLIHKAFHYSIKVHEIDQKQKRKGKDVPYVTHPIHVGFILSKAGASDELIAAGFLHDVLEDSIDEAKVTVEELEAEFGKEVAALVASVSEKNRDLSWHERKEAALEEIRQFSHESLMLKSGDVISNTTELMSDYEHEGNNTFKRFNAPKAELIEHAQLVITTILSAWPENPLAADLRNCHRGLEAMKPDVKVTYSRSNVSDEASSKILAAALKPVFEEMEKDYANKQEMADTEKTD